ncbi:MAG: rod shape-determining protein MreC [Puniceicoccales bacterium]|nr:rod shape-determining protein MreC [Puniceicoccales bacterium]
MLCFETQSQKTLAQLCQALAQENAALKLQLEQNFDLKERYVALENLTQIGQRYTYKKVFAHVIQRNVSAWFESLKLDKGKSHGVKENAIAVAYCGIVGKVTEVFEKFSTVTLTSSPKFRLAVCLENFRMPMIFLGNGYRYKRNSSGKYELKASGSLKNIPIRAQPFLYKGARIICSSLTSTAPEGLTLGHVESVYPSVDGMFLTADVILPQGLFDFYEVMILLPDDL